jgi:hypothetical protein
VRAGGLAVELAVHTLVGLIHEENLGDPHPVFAGGEQYASHRFAGDNGLRAELAGAGLTGRGELADFTGMLSIVQRARTEFYGWVTSHDDTYAVLVAAHGRNAFALTRRDDRVVLQRVSADRMVAALLDRLPDVPPGRGESISVSEAEVTGPRPRGEQARRLDTLLRAPRLAITKLYAARRDEGGRRVRGQGWVDLVDLAEGRWLVHTTANRGERVVNAVVATPAVVAAKVGGLVRTACQVS